jgi:hypothetical protein
MKDYMRITSYYGELTRRQQVIDIYGADALAITAPGLSGDKGNYPG